MTGDALYVGIKPGALHVQGEARILRSEYGFDTGSISWVTHPATPDSLWPQRGAELKYSSRGKLFITDIEALQEESGLVLLTAAIKGSRIMGDVMKERIIPGCDLAMFTLPSLQSAGSSQKVRIVAPVPKPRVAREYLTTKKPNFTGVGLTATDNFLPELPPFSISYIPDPDEPITLNYGTGWKLDSRTWEEFAGAVWVVTEVYSYYYPLAV